MARTKQVDLRLVLVLVMVGCLSGRSITADAGVLGSQRVGMSSATFLKIGVGARPAAMGHSLVAVPGDPVSLFDNPAGLADIHGRAFIAERISWLTDIEIAAVGLAAPVGWGGVGGISVMALNVEMAETTELEPNGTGRMFSHRDVAVGVSYARHLTDRFSLGMCARLVYEALGTEIGGPSGTTWVADIGTTFHTGFRNVVLAVAIQNFGPDLTPGGGFVDHRPGYGAAVDYSSFAPPTTFRLGSAYELWAGPRADLNLTGEFVRPSDNDETLRCGAEFALADDLLSLRGGYDGACDALPWSLGLGVAWGNERFDAHFDYSFSHSEYFDRVDRLSLKIVF